MKDIKVGIVGLGRLGSVHAQNLAFKIPGCKLVAACSLEQKELDWAKDYLKVEYTTTDYKKMVDEADIEAVVIVSSSPEHCWMIEYALDAGKHVYTDKPLGCSLEECKRAEAAVERHPDKLFFLGFMRRYDRGYAEMKRIIDSGELGAPLMIHACHRNVSQPDGFRTEMGVSNVAIHELDICRWLLGDEYESGQVLKVRQSACSTKGYDNPQIVLLETKSGARIDVEVQVADAYGYDIQCQVVCEKGTVNLPDPYAVVKRANASRSFPILTDWKDRFIEAYDIELTHWVKTLEEKGEPDGPSAWDGYAACVAADALNRSRGTGRFLPIETMEKPELYK